MKKEIEIRIPPLPTFVYDIKGTQYDLRTDFSEKELSELLKEWTDAILKRVKK